MEWTQTRHFPNRICWVIETKDGRTYALRASQRGESTLLEMRRTNGRTVAERRSVWQESIANPSGDLDQIKNIALTWAALHV